MAKKRYSELECFVLGLVWQLGPCSAYDIRRHMTRSPSTQWSASAGAIYPLVQRLHKRGLLSSKAERNGKRGRRVYAVTPTGLKALRAWVGPPLAEEAATVAYDPLRSRARFLGALTREQQLEWVEEARRALDEVERKVRSWQETYGEADLITTLVTRNGEMDVEARKKWIDEVGRVLREAPAATVRRGS